MSGVPKTSDFSPTKNTASLLLNNSLEGCIWSISIRPTCRPSSSKDRFSESDKPKPKIGDKTQNVRTLAHTVESIPETEESLKTSEEEVEEGQD